MSAYDLTTKTSVVTASNTVATFGPVYPYKLIRVSTAVDLLLAESVDPDANSFLLKAGTVAVFHIENDGSLHYATANDTETGVVRFIALTASGIETSVAGSGGGGGGDGGPITITPAHYTPAALTTNAVATGGTPVTAASGPLNGGWIENPTTATENLYIDMVGTPASTDADAAGTTTTVVVPGQIFTIPAIATGVNVKINAATSGHKFSGEKW